VGTTVGCVNCSDRAREGERAEERQDSNDHVDNIRSVT
jgi:hypothetical protein